MTIRATSIAAVGLVIGGAVTASCAAGGSDEPGGCRSGAECASGVCLSNGQCAAPSDAGQDSASEAGTGQDAAKEAAAQEASAEGAVGEDASSPDVTEAGACADDGVIQSGEGLFAAGVQADYRVSTTVKPFSSAGTCSGDVCTWDFVDLNATTVDDTVVNAPLQDQWFAHEPEFANAGYASLLGPVTIGVCSYVEYGVYRLEGDSLLLVGLVSETADYLKKTKLSFDPPVPVLRFPLQKGATWTIDTVARGNICDSALEYAIDQTYTFAVDKSGTLKVPAGEFPVLRVNMLMDRKLGVGVTATQQRTHMFVAPCAPLVARILGPDGSDTAELEEAVSARRLLQIK